MPHQRADMCNYIQSLVKKITDPFHLVEIIHAVMAIPPNQWIDVSIGAKPFLEKIMDGYHKQLIIRLIALIPQNQMGEYICTSFFFFFTQEITNQNVLNSIIKIFTRDASEPMYEYVQLY